MPDVFLSYSRDDQPTARRFAEGFEREGLSVWWDATLQAGEAYDQVTEKALREAKAVVVLWSKKSVDSRWVRAEATTADRNKTLVPVMIEPCTRPIMFELTHTADLSHWKGDPGDKAWKTYVADVHRFVQRGEPIPSVPQAAHRPHPSSRFGARSIAILAAAALIVGGGVLWAVVRDSGEQPAAQAATVAPAAPRTSIAVMPFANLTGDPNKEYLGDGMSEELLNVLANVPGLKVPSRTSSFAYKGRNTDLKQVASDLNVGTILEGSVRSAGETIRITAQLIDAQTDTHLWSETYDRQFTDLFKLQDELAEAIVIALQVNLNGASPASVVQAPPTQNVEAYDLALQATAVASRLGPRDFAEAMTLLHRALALDPKFARALAGLAQIRLGHVVFGYPLPNALQDAEREAAQALEMDPGLASAQEALGTIHAYRGEWLEADARFKDAISGDAGHVGHRTVYANNLLDSVGHLQQSLEQRREAHRLAPAAPSAANTLAVGYSLIGRDSDALKYLDMALKLGTPPNVTPVPQVFANAAARSGNYAEAADRMVGTLPAVLRAAGGEAVIRGAYAALGDPTKKPAASDALQDLLGTLNADDLNVNTRKDLIAMFTQLGAVERAFDLTNESLDLYARTTGTVGSAWGVLWLPEMRPFRQDARFQALVERMKLPDYWQEFGPPDGCDLQEDKLICH